MTSTTTSPIVASPIVPTTTMPPMASIASSATPTAPPPTMPSMMASSATPSLMQQFVDTLNDIDPSVANSYSTNPDRFDLLLKEAHDNVPQAIALYFAQKSSAEASMSASAAPTSASGALTPPNQTPMYLRNPEIFVVNYVQIHGNRLMSNEMYRQDVHGRNLFKFAQVFHNWLVLQTVGDGNCLTHAFLQCLSPTYGKIWDPDPINNCPNKTAVARAFRLDFAKNSPLAVSKQAYNAGNGLTDLSDVQITDYSRLFNVITVVFEQKNINPLDSSPEFVNPIMAYNLTQYSKPHDKVIFIHGDGMHYSSILLPGIGFEMTLVEATTQIPELVRVLTPIGGFII